MVCVARVLLGCCECVARVLIVCHLQLRLQTDQDLPVVSALDIRTIYRKRDPAVGSDDVRLGFSV